MLTAHYLIFIPKKETSMSWKEKLLLRGSATFFPAKVLRGRRFFCVGKKSILTILFRMIKISIAKLDNICKIENYI